MMSETSALRATVVGYSRGPGGIEDTMRTHWLRVAIASSVVALGIAACGSDATGGTSGGSTISIWEGWTGAEAKAFAHLVSVYQKQNPGTTVKSLYVNNDNTLQKVL